MGSWSSDEGVGEIGTGYSDNDDCVHKTAETGCLCSHDNISNREEAGCSGMSLPTTKSQVLQFI